MIKICKRADCKFYIKQEKYLDKCIECLQHICWRCFQCNKQDCQLPNLLTDHFETK